MKKAIALVLAVILALSLCGCNFVRDMARERTRDSIRDSWGDEAVSYYDYAMEQYDKEWEELGDLQEQLARQLQRQLEAEWEQAMSDVKDDIRQSVEEALDGVINTDMDTSLFVTIPDGAGCDIAVLTNFPNAKMITTLTEYPLKSYFPNPSNKSSTTFELTIDGKTVKMGSMQCLAYARYVQTKLYGDSEYTNSSHFRNILYDFNSSGQIAQNTLTQETLKAILKAAGPGAHLRAAGSQHSMILISVDDNGFQIIDANGTSDPMLIREHYYTWANYLKPDGYGQRGFAYVNVYVP